MATKWYYIHWESLITEDGILKRIWENSDGAGCKLKVDVPKNKITEVLEEIPSIVGGGYLGTNPTLEKVTDNFCWIGYRSDVENWGRNCMIWAAAREPRTRSHGRMWQYNVGDHLKE